MFTILRHNPIPFLYLKTLTFPSTSRHYYPFLHHYPSPFSLHFCTNTSDSPSFAVSYLIHNFGLSPLFANKLCSTYRLTFKTAQKPDSVLAFFRNQGFSDSQLHNMITRTPGLLSCNPSKRVLPKFQFFLSKGASNSDIVDFLSKNPLVLSASLDNHIVPTYELVYRFLQSDKDAIACAIHHPKFFGSRLVPCNIRLLIENGVSEKTIARILRNWCRSLYTHNMLKLVEELKDLGFNPSQSIFGIALLAKTSVNKTLWKEKVDAFKKWGWSDQDVMEAFRRQPHCMLTSIDKINLVMSFWVNELGWDAMVIAKVPRILGASLERTIIPRVSVIQYLQKKGLRKKNASLTKPLIVGSKHFFDRYVNCFKDESSYILKLYKEKLNQAHAKDKAGM
ncbi:uncharacterized protein [Cicer arietinum]|uniref:Uncharacterized protein LOC113785830 n=1 Tax=Cicer arietinum TaxID=3827 RepID=A0A3Q7X4U6_CICAR|nr:uncharacterized protein LOC113785830 [Cicer arietinum]XP_027188721.1 uncharacterized protein LOC113785830 [Cicer arietinum]